MTYRSVFTSSSEAFSERFHAKYVVYRSLRCFMHVVQHPTTPILSALLMIRPGSGVGGPWRAETSGQSRPRACLDFAFRCTTHDLVTSCNGLYVTVKSKPCAPELVRTRYTCNLSPMHVGWFETVIGVLSGGGFLALFFSTLSQKD